MMEQKKNVAGPLPAEGVRDPFATILEHMTGRTSSLAKGTGLTDAALLEAVSEAVGNAVGEAVATGTDLVPATKAIVVGVLRGTEAKDEAALKILSTTARAVVLHTADRGGNLAAASKGLVLGAIASAKAMGIDVARAASTAAQGAYEGAVSAGPVTVERVVGALKESIGGIRVALPDPQPT
jgi:hypothetical protein